MMRSMFSGVSGLRVHQTKMDVIANNISNVNTVGYKSSRVTFQEVFSQTLAGASGANPAVGRGGVNAMQIGLGANVASIDMIMTQGAAQRTDNPYDIMIQGEGFFIVSDASGTYFTRSGAFRLDESGYITTPDGMMLNGWKASYNTLTQKYEIPKNKTQPIQITGSDVYLNPQVTTSISFEGNLNHSTDGTKGKESTIAYYDSLGNRYVQDVKFVLNAAGTAWDIQLGNRIYPGGDKDKAIGLTLTTNTATGETGITAGATPVPAFAYTTIGSIAFDTNGYPDPATLGGFSLKFAATAAGTTGLAPNALINDPIRVDLTGLTQFVSDTTASSVTNDGRNPGTLSGISIGSDGIVTGRYSNGLTKPLWQIPIAQFKNPAGLERMGANLYVATPNSGDFDGVGVPAGAGTTLLAGVLEMSNVDLAQEFTEMITTQRGFQANSRIITTSDDMLQELVNLKR